MCLAYPGKILSKQGDKALIDFNGLKKEVNLLLVKAKVGEHVLVHAGFAIEKISTEEAQKSLEAINKIL